MLTSNRFLASAAVALALLYGSFIGLNVTIDPFDRFHPESKVKRSVIWNERYSKYMLSAAYIPNNFDSLLVGSSVADGFPVEKTLPVEKIYNGSLDGGSLLELVPIVERATRSGRIKKVYLCIDPYEIKSSVYKTNIGPDTIDRETYGSMNTVRLYARTLYDLAFHKPPDCGPQGGLDDHLFGPPEIWWQRPASSQTVLAAMKGKGLVVDPLAGESMSRIGQICSQRGALLLPFLSPVPSIRYQAVPDLYLNLKTWTSGKLQGRPVYDVNLSPNPKAQALLNDPATFVDGTHPKPAVAGELWEAIWQELKQER